MAIITCKICGKLVNERMMHYHKEQVCKQLSRSPLVKLNKQKRNDTVRAYGDHVLKGQW